MSEALKKMSTVPSFDGKEITDDVGRKIILRKADIMDRFYLLRAMGADSGNQALVAMMLPTLYVAAIDGSPFPTPRSQIECEAGLKRLGEEGYLAVSEEVSKYFEERDKNAKEIIKK